MEARNIFKNNALPICSLVLAVEIENEENRNNYSKTVSSEGAIQSRPISRTVLLMKDRRADDAANASETGL